MRESCSVRGDERSHPTLWMSLYDNEGSGGLRCGEPENGRTREGVDENRRAGCRR